MEITFRTFGAIGILTAVTMKIRTNTMGTQKHCDYCRSPKVAAADAILTMWAHHVESFSGARGLKDPGSKLQTPFFEAFADAYREDFE